MTGKQLTGKRLEGQTSFFPWRANDWRANVLRGKRLSHDRPTSRGAIIYKLCWHGRKWIKPNCFVHDFVETTPFIHKTTQKIVVAINQTLYRGIVSIESTIDVILIRDFIYCVSSIVTSIFCVVILNERRAFNKVKCISDISLYISIFIIENCTEMYKSARKIQNYQVHTTCINISSASSEQTKPFPK